MRIELALLRYTLTRRRPGVFPISITDHRPGCLLAPAILLSGQSGFRTRLMHGGLTVALRDAQYPAPEGPTSRRTVFES